MDGIRVSSIPEDLDEEDLKIYFSNANNAGGKINKIYFPLLNNDAVIFFQNPEVVDVVLSRDHRIDGNQVDLVRTETMVFAEIKAKLKPEISSLVAVSNKIKDRLRFIINVQLEEDPHDHCLVMIGNMYQIEKAWNTISKSLKAQQKMHSKIYQRQESKDGDREKSTSRKDADNDARGTSFVVNHNSLSNKLRGENSSKVIKETVSDAVLESIDSDPYSSHGYHKQSTAKFVEDSANRRQISARVKTSSARGTDDVHNYSLSHYQSDFFDQGARPKDSSTAKYNQLDFENTDPKSSSYDQFDLISAASANGIAKEKLTQNQNSLLDSGYENTRTSDHMPAHGSKTYQVIEPKVQICKIGDLSDDTTDEDEVQRLFKSSKGSTDSERSRQANDTFREFSTITHQPTPIENKSILNEPMFSTDFSVSSYKEFDIGNLKIVIEMKNITAVETDGLVNAANGSLSHAGGVASAISRAADHRLESECDSYIRKHGMMATSQVMHTSAGGRLKVKHILHAVGPIWLERVPEKCTYELIQTYLNCFEYADSQLKISSISVPCISSGIFGAPLDTSVQSFLDAVLLHYDQNRSKPRQHLREIHMVNNDEDCVVTTIVIIKSLLDEGLDKAIHIAKEKFIKLKGSVSSSSTSSARYQSHTDDWTPRSPASHAGNIRRTSSLDRNAGRFRNSDGSSSKAKPDRHEFKTTSYKVDSAPLSTESRTKSGKQIGRSPVLKQTLTNPSSLRPKTAPSRNKTSSILSKPEDVKRKDDFKFGTNYDFKNDDGFDGMASLPAHLIYQNHQEDCPICFDHMKNPKVLEKCGHSFCQKCIDRHFSSGKPVCPTCGMLYGVVRGDQPLATMSYKIDRSLQIPGFRHCDGAIIIQYSVPAGIQMKEHPNPGKRYKALKRTAYLPHNTEGKQVYRLLKKAFDNKLIFTIGESRTMGKEDVVTWNDIHHKTSVDGGPTKFGYPDPTYLNRVKEELAAKGIVD